MKIFFSYALEDRTSEALIIAEALDADGHSVTMSVNGILGGANWRKEAKQAILDADLFIALVSSAYKNAIYEWQVLFALENKKRVVPVMIHPTEPLPIFEKIDPIYTIVDASHLGEVVAFGIKEYTKNNQAEKPEISTEEISKARENLPRTLVSSRIFIAYSRKQRALAQALSDMLVRSGKAVFYDAKIKAGATWRQTIQKALDDATHVVVIWTPDAAVSDEVDREVSYALAEHKVVVPILNKEIPKLPYHLHGLHYIILEDELTKIEPDLLKAIEQHKPDEDIWQ